MTAPHRSPARILAELAEVRRHLHEAPPHHGDGRAALERRVDQLQAELAHARHGSRRSGGTSRAGPAAGSASD